MKNQNLKRLIGAAYSVREDRISGGPKWVTSDRFDVEARAAGPANDRDLLLMLQSMLAERFQLGTHRETVLTSGFALVVAKGGLKIHPDGTEGGGGTHSTRGKMSAERITMAGLADWLTRQLGAPVVDMTDVKGVFTFKLEWTPDGGGSIAADQEGNVYVAWHGIALTEAEGSGEGEARRRMFLTRSENDGQSFSAEQRAWSQATGACGCCGMRTHVDRKGNLWALYRSATESVHRDIYLLSSKDRGKTFQGSLLHKWEINACPMSSMDIADNGQSVVGAWETGGQVYWTRLDAGSRQPTAPAGEGKGRKHPRLAINRAGEVLLVWTEGTGWQKGGGLAWQLYDKSGQPVGERRQMAGIPTWSFAAAIARPDDGFSVLN